MERKLKRDESFEGKITYKIYKNKHTDQETFKYVKFLMSDFGFILDVKGTNLSIELDPEKLKKAKRVKAGRRRLIDLKTLYSDVVGMMQFMTDKEIAASLHMAIATYYRHKKTMLESKYYQHLDKNRLCDDEYLKSAKYNDFF